METVTHDGRTTAYRRTGTGDAPVLYVHGSGATHQVWVHQYGARRPRPAAALDLSGHGESDDVDVESARDALDAYADDALAVARATGARVLAGNSLGGAVVLHVALERQFAPEALVLVGTGARLPVDLDLRGWLTEDFERVVEYLHGPDVLFHDPEPAWIERTKAALRATGAEVTARDFRASDAFDARGRLDGVDVPALVVYGEHDRLTPPGCNEDLADGLPDAELVEIRDAAHLPMLERSEAFNEAVSEFLDGV